MAKKCDKLILSNVCITIAFTSSIIEPTVTICPVQDAEVRWITLNELPVLFIHLIFLGQQALASIPM